ncbi:MAG: zinc ribbon domain-containing protein [Candidatus Magasanikbacteria bacterium]|jgi:hypothetical protein|nr:zinc ribbon domain-containing protein [Candidatus Magasanikbacteria bacterium]
MVDRINSCPSCGAEISIGDTRCNYCSSEFKSEVSTGKIDLKSRLCPFCKFNADLDEEYCPNCGDNLIFKCPHCYSIKFIITKFCKKCGKDISHLSKHLVNKDYVGISNFAESITTINLESGIAVLKEAYESKSFNIDNKNAHLLLLKYAEVLHQKYIKLLSGSSQSLLGTTYAKKEKIINLLLNSNAKQSLKDKAQALLIQRGKKEEKSGCFIATATMGDYNHPYVIELRNFRDQILQKFRFGRIFIVKYYKYSPYFTKKISSNYYIRNLMYIFIVYPLYRISKFILKE